MVFVFGKENDFYTSYNSKKRNEKYMERKFFFFHKKDIITSNLKNKKQK